MTYHDEVEGWDDIRAEGWGGLGIAFA